jgi:CubicO group peptidase (beta-lactamase class C family)
MTNARRFLVVTVVVLGLSFLNGRLYGSEPLDAREVQKLLDQHKVPGVSIAVIKDFRIVWAKGYGIADKANNSSVTTETLFQAASISKPVAAMASLKAAENGIFKLDQDVNTILKSWKLPMSGFKGPVSPRMLMSHTSGLGDGFGFPGYAVISTLPDYVQMMDGRTPANHGKIRLEREPMTAFEYSGGGALMQEFVLTEALGKEFSEIMREWIFGPLGMTNSTFSQPLPKSREAQASRAHDRNGARGVDPWRVYPEHAAAGLWTTPSDLARFAVEVQKTLHGEGGRVIKRASALEMVSPVGVGDYAVGFEMRKMGQGWYFAHGGGNWGFTCYLLAHVSNGYGVVVMSNGAEGGPLLSALVTLIQQADKWDALDEAPQRAYGPMDTAARRSEPKTALSQRRHAVAGSAGER